VKAVAEKNLFGNQNGNTALIAAAFMGYMDIASALLEKNAKTESKNNVRVQRAPPSSYLSLQQCHTSPLKNASKTKQ